MKTEKELNEDIVEITMKIRSEFPELSKYIEEMPVQISAIDDKGINSKNLKNYYDSLKDLLKKYSEEHNSLTKQSNK